MHCSDLNPTYQSHSGQQLNPNLHSPGQSLFCFASTPMSNIRSCGSLVAGNEQLLKVKREPKEREEELAKIAKKREEGSL